MTQFPGMPHGSDGLPGLAGLFGGLPKVPGLNILDEIMKRVDGMNLGLVWRGTVTGTTGNLVAVRRTDQAAADPQSYPRLSSYTPVSVGDEVIVQRVGHNWIVMGKVLR